MAREGLTPKQQRFVEEYLIDLNASAAYRRAGYSSGTPDVCGPRLLGNVGVQAAIEAGSKARSVRTEITQDWVIKKLKENVERAMQAQPVLDRDGNEIGEFRYEGAVANGALKLLGEHLKMFTTKTESTVTTKNASDLSDEDLARIAAGRGAGASGEAQGADEPS